MSAKDLGLASAPLDRTSEWRAAVAAKLEMERKKGTHPGCFAQRVWICLKMREIAFAEWSKSSEEYQNKWDRAWRGVRGRRWVERGTSGTPKRKRQRRFAGARRRKRKTKCTADSISLSIEKCKCLVVKRIEASGSKRKTQRFTRDLAIAVRSAMSCSYLVTFGAKLCSERRNPLGVRSRGARTKLETISRSNWRLA